MKSQTLSGAAPRRHTLRDVARLAKVDVSTVSRSLKGDPRISVKQARAICRTAEKLGYRPKPFRGKRAQAIGLLYASADVAPDNDFLQRIIWTAQAQLARRGFSSPIEAILPAAAGAAELPLFVRENRVDGVLLLGFLPPVFFAALQAVAMPAVAINDAFARVGIPCARSNPEPAIAETITQLAARGHRHFALLVSNTAYPTVAARLRAFRQTLANLGLPAGTLFSGLGPGLAGGREGLTRALASAPPPTALLCENDWLALGAQTEAQQRGLRIPADLSVIGHDDLWVCQETAPRLSSIHRDEENLVTSALTLLQRVINGETDCPQEVMVEESAVFRESAGLAPRRSD